MIFKQKGPTNKTQPKREIIRFLFDLIIYYNIHCVEDKCYVLYFYAVVFMTGVLVI